MRTCVCGAHSVGSDRHSTWCDIGTIGISPLNTWDEVLHLLEYLDDSYLYDQVNFSPELYNFVVKHPNILLVDKQLIIHSSGRWVYIKYNNILSSNEIEINQLDGDITRLNIDNIKKEMI